MGKSGRIVLPSLRWHSSNGRYTVTVSVKAFRQMLELASAHTPNEVGTCLIGWYSHDGFDAHVASIGPLPSDSVGTRTTFLRGVQGLKEFFSNLALNKKPKHHYVGEWHSHPMAAAVASSQDDHDHSAIAHDTVTNCKEVIMAIVGGDFATKPDFRVYIYSRKRGKVELIPKPE